MTAAEKFNKTVGTIEQLVAEGEYNSSEIGMTVARQVGLGIRDLTAVFNFLVDMTLNDYIIGRRLNAAYAYLLEGGAITDAVQIAGYGDQPSFNKAFKRRFDLTPGDAKKRQDRSLLTEPLAWKHLSDEFASAIEKTEDEATMEKKIFGIASSSFEKVSKALELESFYGFTKLFSNYAFDLSQRTGRNLEDCFRYAASLRDYGGDYSTGYDEEDNMTPEERLQEEGDNETTQELFFTLGISVDMISELLFDHSVLPEELLSCDKNILLSFPGFKENVDISFSYYVEAYNYYAMHFDIDETPDSFEEYIDYICVGTPIEVALEIVSLSAEMELDDYDFDDYLITDPVKEMQDIERSQAFDALAEEEERWHGKRIDDDLYYDSENDYFDQYDREDIDEW